MITNNVIVASKTAPNPITTRYWADLTENPYGGVIKFYNGSDWDYLNNTDDSADDLKDILSFVNNIKNDTVTVVRPSSIITTTTTVGIDTIERTYRVRSNGDLLPDEDDGMGNTITLPAATTTKAGVMTSTDKTNLDNLVTKITELENRIAALETPAA